MPSRSVRAAPSVEGPGMAASMSETMNATCVGPQVDPAERKYNPHATVYAAGSAHSQEVTMESSRTQQEDGKVDPVGRQK